MEVLRSREELLGGVNTVDRLVLPILSDIHPFPGIYRPGLASRGLSLDPQWRPIR